MVSCWQNHNIRTSLKMSFQTDLVIGRAAEKIVLSYVKQFLPNATLIDRYEPKGDIFSPPNKWIEVKCDLRANETGNLIVETYYGGNPSGLKTTKSYRWVFYTGSHLVVSTPEKLRRLIKASKRMPSEFFFKGDNKARIVHYLDKDTVIKDAISVVKLNEEGMYEIT